MPCVSGEATQRCRTTTVCAHLVHNTTHTYRNTRIGRSVRSEHIPNKNPCSLLCGQNDMPKPYLVLEKKRMPIMLALACLLYIYIFYIEVINIPDNARRFYAYFYFFRFFSSSSRFPFRYAFMHMNGANLWYSSAEVAASVFIFTIFTQIHTYRNSNTPQNRIGIRMK